MNISKVRSGLKQVNNIVTDTKFLENLAPQVISYSGEPNEKIDAVREEVTKVVSDIETAILGIKEAIISN